VNRFADRAALFGAKGHHAQLPEFAKGKRSSFFADKDAHGQTPDFVGSVKRYFSARAGVLITLHIMSSRPLFRSFSAC
jgi:hypothetical protein